MSKGSTCRICEDDHGIGMNFGSSFLCRSCEEELWDFIRKAIIALKKKEKKG